MPFCILYTKSGVGGIFQCGPFATEDEAMKYVDDYRHKDGDYDPQREVVFNLECDVVYLMRENHQMVELQNADFDDGGDSTILFGQLYS